jgi:hypothetical protein
MVDPSIRGECSVILLSRFADIISQCIQVILSFLSLHALFIPYLSTVRAQPS